MGTVAKRTRRYLGMKKYSLLPNISKQSGILSNSKTGANTGFYGAGDSTHDPGFAYLRLKQLGVAIWFKGRVTECFPPEDERFPWDMVTWQDPPKSGTYKCKVAPGLIGGILPSNYDDEFTVNSGVTYGIVECTTNGEAVTSATISFNSTFPTPVSATVDKAPTSFKVCFGMLDKQSDAAPFVFNFWRKSQSAVPNAAFVQAVVDPTQPHKFYYTWRVG